MPSPLSGSSAFPPVSWWLVPNHGRCDLYLEVVAELPQLLRRAGVLEENPINFDRTELAGTVAIDGAAHLVNKLTKLRVVVVRDNQARRPSFRFAGHEYEATHGIARFTRARTRRRR